MRAYAYVVTLQWQTSRGLSSGTYTGVVELREGTSRSVATDEVLRYAKKALGVSEGLGANVLFLSLEPNELQC
jgi:hypothetical protein